jgi:Glucosyl transferase GtrII
MQSSALTSASGQNRLLTIFGFSKFERSERRTFFFAWALYALVLLPILIADRYNVDDWGRAVLGYSDWNKDGRPLAELVMVGAALGKPLIDFSPIPQIAAITCLAFLSVLVSRKFGIDRPLVAACAALPLGANPFFLADLGFKFDALSITLALACALIPTLQDERAEKETALPVVVGCVSLLASLGLYQPALNAFLVFSILEFIFLQKRNAPPRKLLLLITKRGGQLFAAVGIYRLVVFLTMRQGYGTENSRLIADIRSFGMIWQNFYGSWSIVLGSLWPRLKWPLLLPIAIALVFSVVIGFRYRQTFANGHRLRALLWSAISFLIPIALVLATYGFLVLLERSPVRSPRTFIGFGALLSGSLIIIVGGLNLVRVPGSWQCALLSIPTYVLIYFAAIYGNMAKVQNEYEKHFATKLSDDIKELVALQSVDRLMIEGTVGYAPTVQRAIKTKYPLLNLLIPVELCNDGAGFSFPNSFLRYNGVKLDRDDSEPRRAKMRAMLAEFKPIRTSIYYQVYIIEKEMIVWLFPPAKPGF